MNKQINVAELIACFKRNISMHKNGPVLTSAQFSDEAKADLQGFVRGLERGLEIVELTEASEPVLARKFNLGDRVRKIKGSDWHGIVVGFYSTDLTAIGYCIESEREKGSVQIYPEAALEPDVDRSRLDIFELATLLLDLRSFDAETEDISEYDERISSMLHRIDALKESVTEAA